MIMPRFWCDANLKYTKNSRSLKNSNEWIWKKCERKKRNKTKSNADRICFAWCVDENKRLERTAAASRHRPFVKFDQKTFARTPMWMGWNPLLILILVILLCFVARCAMPTYKCIFYLSDCNLRKFEAYGLWKIIDKENTSLSLIAHRIRLVDIVVGVVFVIVVCVMFFFRISKSNILQSLIGRMKFM